MADIGFITVLYFLSGFFAARLFDNYLDKFNKEKEDKKTAKIVRRHNNINTMAYKEKIEWLK